MEEILTITQVTKAYGISTRTLRYYEQMGLITSLRIEGYAYRVYDHEACARLSQILVLRKLRIPLKQIASLLSDNNVIGTLGVFMQHINDLDEEMAALAAIRKILQSFVDKLRENPNIHLKTDMLNDERLLFQLVPLSQMKNNFGEEKMMKDILSTDNPLGDAAGGVNPANERQNPEDIAKLLAVDPILLLFGYELIPLVDTNQGGDVLERIVMIRRTLALEKGMVIPIIRLKDDVNLNPTQYTISIKGTEVARGEIMMGHSMAVIGEGEVKEIDGIETVEPCEGKPAFWIPASGGERAEALGCTIIKPPVVLASHLTAVIRHHLHQLLTLQEVEKMVAHVKEDNPALINELIPQYLTLNNVKQILTKLLENGVSIRDMLTILETLLDYVSTTQDIDKLAKQVQQKLC